MEELKETFLKKILPIIIIIIIIGSGILILNHINIKKNMDNLNNYIKDNKYTIDKYNLYTLTKKDNNTTLTYQLLPENYFITKTIIAEDDNENITKITLSYNKNNTIDIELEYNGLNKNNNFAIQAQTAKLIDNDFKDCKIVLDNNVDNKCDIMKEEATIFNDEVKKIINDYEIDLKYIKKSQIK